MNKTYLFITALFVLIFMSCQSRKKNNAEKQNEIELVAEKQLVFPLDEQTYYLSKSMFQFEENGKEYLHFENTRKSLYDIVIFDIENKQIAKRIPLHKTGPNGLPAVYGSRPSPDSKQILISQNNIGRLSTINNQGEVVHNYPVKTPEGRFTTFFFCSYYNAPAFVKDSCIFLNQGIFKPNMKREDWPQTHMFASQNLETGKFEWVPIFYPPIFKEEYENIDGGYGFSYDYNYKESRLVCGFFGYDSLMVTDDLKHIRWYNAKSKYLKSMKPKLGNAMALSAGDIHRIADLGRIDISDEQVKVMQGELNDIFQMIEQIRSIDTSGVEPMPNPHDGIEHLRDDIVTEGDNRTENMKNAPEKSEGYFLVPQVIE